MDKSNAHSMQSDIANIHSEAIVAWGGNVQCPETFLKAHRNAVNKLACIQNERLVDDLVAKLRNASEEELLQHAREHTQLLAQAGELATIKDKTQAVKAEREREEQLALSMAHKLKSDICRELYRQMVYTNPKLKHSAKNISYKRSGVTSKVFAAAFGVPEGPKGPRKSPFRDTTLEQSLFATLTLVVMMSKSSFVEMI